MKISTKGRYALRMLYDLALHQEEGYVSLKDIADRAVRDDTAPRGADIWFDFDQ